jgi:monofunctional biosynthetic peptidoglycan transglycosylase
MRIIWIGASLAGLWLSVVALYVVNIPDVSVMKGCFKTTMFEIELCPNSENYVTLSNISSVARYAIMLSEDASFYSHDGFDWYEIQSAFRRTVDNVKKARGASTITQQLAKNLFLNGERTLIRKLREAYITVQIERTFGKDEILEKYLNVVEFGPQIYGIKAASQYYFKKHPRNLNLLEATYLAYLLPNPKAYSVTFKKKKLDKYAQNRISNLLQRLYRFQKISSYESQWAELNLINFPWYGYEVPRIAERPSGDPSDPSGETIEGRSDTGSEELYQETQAFEPNERDTSSDPASSVEEITPPAPEETPLEEEDPNLETENSNRPAGNEHPFS